MKRRHNRKDIITSEIRGTTQVVIFSNGVVIGQIYQEVDGYYVFLPDRKDGFWEAYVLRAIANLLDKKNEKWHKQVMKDLQSKEK
ncbi:MAG: hypothetical protein WC554_09070 [Clostridia bacterium]|jgi:hypothetical protein